MEQHAFRGVREPIKHPSENSVSEGCFIVVLFFIKTVDHGNAPFVSSALKLGVDKQINHVECKSCADDSSAQTKDIRVVMQTGKTG